MGVIEDFSQRWKQREADERKQARRADTKRRALTAAGSRVNLASPKLADTKREQWQTEAWAYRDKVPELRFAGEFVSSALSRLEVFPAENRPRGEAPVPLERASKRQQDVGEIGVDQETIEAAVACVEHLNLNQHGASLLGRIAENLEFAGQCFLLGERTDEGESAWSVRSVLECQITQGGGLLYDGETSTPRKLRNDECDLLNLWTPHPARYREADSVVRSVLDTLEDMWAVAASGRARNKSRIGSGTVFYLPTEFTMTRPGGAPIDADLPGAFEDGEQDPFMAALVEYMTTPIMDQSDPSSVVPLVVRGPAMLNDRPMKDLVGTIDLHGGFDSKALTDQYESLVMRFARGINLAPERVKGLGDTNNWQANVITADEVANAIAPRAERICDSLTAAYLNRMLAGMGISTEQRSKVCLWYNASELTQNPNRSEDAQSLFNAGELSGDALRRYRGFTEADKPTTTERLLRALTQGELANASVPAILRLANGQLPTVSDLTALEQAQAAMQPRPVVDATPHRTPAPPPSLAKTPTPPPKPAAKPDPTPPVGQRTQPATASQPGALGASAGRDHGGKFAGPEQARQWRLDKATGRKLAAIDRALIDTLITLADSCVGRATEKASNRLRAEAVKTGRGGEPRDALAAAAFPKGCDPRAVVAAGGAWLPRLSERAETDQLVDAAIDELEPRFLAEIESAALAVADVLAALPQRTVTAAGPRSRLVERVKRNAADAWRWLAGRLRDHARRVLYGEYTPSRDGESAEGLVPTSLIRGAIALAGGLPERAAGLREDGTSAGEPLGGVATGDTASGELRAAGAVTIGSRWEYPPMPRDHFPGHRDLDGVVFHGWDDPQLKVRSGDEWIGPSYFPQDHGGCRCLWSVALAHPLADDADPNSDEVAELRRKVTSDG